MTRSSRLSILFTVLVLTGGEGVSIVKAQSMPPSAPMCKVNGVWNWCSSSGSGGGGYRPPVYQPGPSRAERAAQKRQAEATAANQRGVDAWNRKDWAAAEKHFREALALEPDDTTLRANLGRVENQLGSDAYFRGDYVAAAELFKKTLSLVTDPEKKFVEDNLALAQDLAQKEANRQREDAAAAEAMRNALSHMVDAVPSTKGSGGVNASGGGGSSGGLTFMGPGSSSTVPTAGSGGNAPTASPGGLNFMGPEASNTFGVKSNPSKPDLGPAAAPPSAKVDSALDQLSSAANSGKTAVDAYDKKVATSPEDAQRQAGCQFSDRNCAQPDHIQVPHPAQTPGTADLLTHIPEDAQQDKKIQESVAWYQKYERNALETEGKLAEVQKQIDSGNGDPAILNAEKGTLTNQLNDQKKLQKMEEDDIKKQLVNIHAVWKEQPPQSESKSTGKP